LSKKYDEIVRTLIATGKAELLVTMLSKKTVLQGIKKRKCETNTERALLGKPALTKLDITETKMPDGSIHIKLELRHHIGLIA
jgi:hypothetical protein